MEDVVEFSIGRILKVTVPFVTELVLVLDYRLQPELYFQKYQLLEVGQDQLLPK